MLPPGVTKKSYKHRRSNINTLPAIVRATRLQVSKINRLFVTKFDIKKCFVPFKLANVAILYLSSSKKSLLKLKWLYLWGAWIQSVHVDWTPKRTPLAIRHCRWKSKRWMEAQHWVETTGAVLRHLASWHRDRQTDRQAARFRQISKRTSSRSKILWRCSVLYGVPFKLPMHVKDYS